MADYERNQGSPWKAYKDEIQTLVFEMGVTKIGKNTFRESHQINTITIPMSMTRIAEYAFYDCQVNDVYSYPTAQNLQIEYNTFHLTPRWHVFSNQQAGYKSMQPAYNVVGDLKAITLDADGDNASWLEAANGSVCDVTLQGLKLVREGFTLCVPFTTGNISTTPLAGAEIYEIAAIHTTDKEMRLRIGPVVSKIEAGKLYYGFWKTHGGDLQSPVFRNVMVSATAPEQKVYTSATLQGFYNACTIENLYTTEVHGTAFSETMGRTHTAFQTYILSPEKFERFKFAMGDYTVRVIHTGKPE